jgi:hypothetical protein
MLPAGKNQYPKCLYLDENKWIDLSRAHYQRPGGEPFVDALGATRTAVASGRLIVPFSVVHAIETMMREEPGSRERLARFMIDLSGNRTILPYMAVRPMEIRQALLRLFGRDPGQPVRRVVIQEGISTAFGVLPVISGGTPEIGAFLTNLCSTSEVSLELLLKLAEDRAFFRNAVAAEEAAVAGFEQVRQRASNDLSPDQRMALELASLLTSGEGAGQDLRAALVELGIGQDDLLKRIGSIDDFKAFALSIPTIDVFVNLLLERDRNRAVQRNDTRDMVWQSVAVPYADLIVMEKSWAHIVRSAKLDQKYQTLVITDSREISDELKKLGCV